MLKNTNKLSAFKMILMFLLIIILLSTDVFIGRLMTLLLSIIIWLIILLIQKKYLKLNKDLILLSLTIMSIPSSYRNVFGGDYGEMPISWFNFFILILFIYVFLNGLFKNEIKLNFITLFALLMIIGGLPALLVSLNFLSGLKQYLNIFIFCMGVILALMIKINKDNYEVLVSDYIGTVRVTSIALLLQILLFKLGFNLGNILLLGGNRDAFGLLFNDFSFLSLYISTGILLVFTFKRKWWQIDFIIMFIACALTSARTGLVAAFLTILLIYLWRILSNFGKKPLKSVLILIGLIILSSFSYIALKIVRPEDTFASSGRIDNYIRGIELFFENIVTGLGFGVREFSEVAGLEIPHNTLIQYSAQGGLIFFLPMLVFILILIFTTFIKTKEFAPVLMNVLIGSLFIPDIFNSRFFLVIAIIIILAVNLKKHKHVEKQFR